MSAAQKRAWLLAGALCGAVLVLDQAIKAVVVLKANISLDPREIQRHCASKLEDFMVPSIVEFRSELPKNERGKVVKRELVAAATTRGDSNQ